jgi:LmbE family N-acetylglucosaminyl deacetylase
LDHIAVSHITTYIFFRLKASPPAGCAVRELAYYCLPREHMPAPSTDYVYMPPGRPASYINRTVEVSDLRETKFGIMRTHHTQRKDAETIIALGPAFHSTDHFHVIT